MERKPKWAAKAKPVVEANEFPSRLPAGVVNPGMARPPKAAKQPKAASWKTSADHRR